MASTSYQYNDNDRDTIYTNNAAAQSSSLIHHNVPKEIEHFVGAEHDHILDGIYNDLTADNTNPFIVLLGFEGVGKSCVATTVCRDLLSESNTLFKNGILYCDLLAIHQSYHHRTLEDCLITAVMQCGLHTYWGQTHDDEFLALTPSNILGKLETHLEHSLIVLEDFDRFMEVNDITLEEGNAFLFRLFDSISLSTKVLITARKKLPIFYNFNSFVTKFYELSAFTRDDSLEFLVEHCSTFDKREIEPLMDDVRDCTAFKPRLLHSLYSLWQNVRVFETSFLGVLALYQEMDETQRMLLAHSQPPSNARAKTSTNANSTTRLQPKYVQTKPVGKPQKMGKHEKHEKHHVQSMMEEKEEGTIPSLVSMVDRKITSSKSKKKLKTSTIHRKWNLSTIVSQEPSDWFEGDDVGQKQPQVDPRDAVLRLLHNSRSNSNEPVDPQSQSQSQSQAKVADVHAIARSRDDDHEIINMSSSPSSSSSQEVNLYETKNSDDEDDDDAANAAAEADDEFKSSMFAYTNIQSLYAAVQLSPANSVGNESFHSPLSTMNGNEFSFLRRPSTTEEDHGGANFLPLLQPTSSDGRSRRLSDHFFKPKRLSLDVTQTRSRKFSAGSNLSPKKRIKPQRLSFDAHAHARVQKNQNVSQFGAIFQSNFLESPVPMEVQNDEIQESLTLLTPIIPIHWSDPEEHSYSEQKRSRSQSEAVTKKFGKNKKHASLMQSSFEQNGHSRSEQERLKTKKIKKNKHSKSLHKNSTIMMATKTLKTQHSREDTPMLQQLNSNNLNAHLSILSLNNGKHENEENVSLVIREDNDDDDPACDTYDSFLAALGKEIHRQQRRESTASMDKRPRTANASEDAGLNIRINGVDVTGGAGKLKDIPLTPPLSSAGGSAHSAVVSDADDEDIDVDRDMNVSVNAAYTNAGNDDRVGDALLSADDDDNVSVNEESIQRNKLISIQLMQMNGGIGAANEQSQSHLAQKKTLKIGDVDFNMLLRMTLLLDVNISGWSRPWLLNGVSRSLRTHDLRLSVHKAMGIAQQYSYVSITCRCDAYDMKQIKQTFEMAFISRELEQCVQQSLAKPALKIICASCVSYRHYQHLYSKQFLKWWSRSLPDASRVVDDDDDDGNSRRHYEYQGMNKMQLIDAEYIQLPLAHKQRNGHGASVMDVMNAQKKPMFTETFGLQDTNEEMNHSLLLTPSDRTVLHWMSVLL